MLQQELAQRLNIDLAAYDFQLPVYLTQEVFGLIDQEFLVPLYRESWME